MPKKSDINIHINDGEAMLYRRERSSYWYLRYKEGVRGWQRKSLGTEDEDRAREKAKQIVAESLARKTLGIESAPSTNFRSIAQIVNDKLSKISNGKNNPYHLKLAITKYLIPFFGNKSVNKIKATEFKDYVSFVEKEMKKSPSTTTLRKHNSALTMIFEYAVEVNKMEHYEVPKKLLTIKREKIGKRGSFSNDEYQSLIRYMENNYEKEARSVNEKMKRALLRDYALFLANSGVRCGTESANIKWRHIDWAKTPNGSDVLTVFVEQSKTLKGKGRKVGLITRGKDKGVARALTRIISRSEKYKDLTLDKMLKKKVNEYVFRAEGDINFTTNMGRMFDKLMRDLDMKYDKTTNNVRTLYSLRHFYVTMALKNERMSIAQLALIIGTSVKMIEDYYTDDINAMNYDGLVNPN